MIDQKLIEYVRKQLNEGRSREQVTTTLMAQGGWNSKDIRDIFDFVNSPTITKPITHDYWYGFSGVVIMTMFGVLNYFLYLKLISLEFIPKALLIFGIIILTPAILLIVFTRVLNVCNRSISKAVFVSSIFSMMPFVLGIIVLTHTFVIYNSTLIIFSTSLFIIWIFIFKRVYETNLLKSLWVGLLQIVFMGIVITSLVFFLGTGNLLNIFNNFVKHRGNNTVDINPEFVSKNLRTTDTINSAADQSFSNFIRYLELYFVNFNKYTPIKIKLDMPFCDGYCPVFDGVMGQSGITFSAPYTTISDTVFSLSDKVEKDKKNDPYGKYSIRNNKNHVQYEYIRSGDDENYHMSAVFLLNNKDFRIMIFQANAKDENTGKNRVNEQQFFDALDTVNLFNSVHKSIPSVPETVLSEKK